MSKLLKEVNLEELKYMRDVEGLGNAEIAKRLDISRSAVYNLLGKGEKSKYGTFTDADLEQIVSMRREGMTLKKISELTGWSTCTISIKLRAANVWNAGPAKQPLPQPKPSKRNPEPQLLFEKLTAYSYTGNFGKYFIAGGKAIICQTSGVLTLEELKNYMNDLTAVYVKMRKEEKK